MTRNVMLQNETRSDNPTAARLAFGSRVRFFRKLLGLTQKQLADICSLNTPDPVFNIERGKSQTINTDFLDQIMRLAIGQQIDPVWLVIGTPESYKIKITFLQFEKLKKIDIPEGVELVITGEGK